MTPLHGGYAKSELQHVLKVACAAVGLDDTDPIVLRGHTNAVVRLSRQPVVVKVARRGSRFAEVTRTVRFVRWLMDQDFPTVPLHPVGDQPVVADGHMVTFWTYLPQPEQSVSAAQIAKPLRALHSLPPPPFPIAELDNVASIRASLAATDHLPRETHRFLAGRIDRLEAALAGVRFELPRAILQGDPQHRNALHRGQRAVLCDWDSFGRGHPEWDLVTIEVHCRRFGYGESHYQEFSDSYGYDVTAWGGYPVVRDLRELQMICTNAKKVAYAPDTLPEVSRRIEGLASADTALKWQIL